MIFISLFKHAGRLFRLLQSTFTFLRHFANVQSLILFPLVVILLMLPAILERKPESKPRKVSEPESQYPSFRTQYGSSNYTLPPN